MPKADKPQGSELIHLRDIIMQEAFERGLLKGEAKELSKKIINKMFSTICQRDVLSLGDIGRVWAVSKYKYEAKYEPSGYVTRIPTTAKCKVFFRESSTIKREFLARNLTKPGLGGLEKRRYVGMFDSTVLKNIKKGVSDGTGNDGSGGTGEESREEGEGKG